MRAHISAAAACTIKSALAKAGTSSLLIVSCLEYKFPVVLPQQASSSTRVADPNSQRSAKGVPVSARMPRAQAARVGRVRRNRTCPATQNVRWLKAANACLQGIPRRQVKEQASTLLERVRLTESAGVRAGAYSGGMRRRLSVAIALLGDPEVVYLDEPTTGGFYQRPLRPTSKRRQPLTVVLWTWKVLPHAWPRGTCRISCRRATAMPAAARSRDNTSMAGLDTVVSEVNRPKLHKSGPSPRPGVIMTEIRTGIPERSDLLKVISGPALQQVVVARLMTVCFRSA